MSEYAPRCPFCANVLKFEPTFWEKIGLKSSKAVCPTCQRTCESRDADTMGTAYWHWAEMFRGQLMQAIAELPVLSEPAMLRALGSPHKEDTKLLPSNDELARACLRQQRNIIIERSRGREANLEVAPLLNETSGQVEAIAVLGTASAESGEREWEQIVARTGKTQYVLYNHPSKYGAHPRVRRAIHAMGQSPTAAAVSAAIPAALHAKAAAPVHVHH